MLEGLVAWVLNNYLGKYVENLNTDQLSVALLSGKVELENLPLKKDAFRHLGLPIEVKSGYIGKVQLQVPVSQIRSAPWIIVIEKLYVVLSPLNLDEWDGVLEANLSHERKVAMLEALEGEWRARTEGVDSGYYASSYSSWLSYGTGLLANIVENLQLQIKDLHIRYEDGLTCSSRFAVGVTVAALVAESCSSSWTRGFTLLDDSACSYKLLELQSLAVYWEPGRAGARCGGEVVPPGDVTLSSGVGPSVSDGYYIVPACSASARVRRERTERPLRARERPRYHIALALPLLHLQLTHRQFSEARACLRGLERISRVREIRVYRPLHPVLGHARAWWVYALKVHLPQQTWMDPKPTWESCLEQSRRVRRYVSTCVTSLQNPTATLPADKKLDKDQFEWNTPSHVLRALREVAMSKVPRATPASTPDKPASGRSMLVHWFPQWWGWYGPESPSQSPPPAAPSPPEALEHEILDVIADSIENNTLLKRDTVFAAIEFTLNKASVTLCMPEDHETGPGSPGAPAKGLEASFWRVRASLESRPRLSSMLVSVRLGALCVRDTVTQGSLFPLIVAPQGMIREGLSNLRSRASGLTSPTAADEDLFHLCYEQRPLHHAGDYRLFVKSQSLEVVVGGEANAWVRKWLAEGEGEGEEPGGGVPAAGGGESTTSRLKHHLDHIMQQREGQRRNGHIELDISAPTIVVCERVTSRDAPLLIVDFGRMRMDNGAAPPPVAIECKPGDDDEDDDEEYMTPCSTPPGSPWSPASPPLPPPLSPPQSPPLPPAAPHLSEPTIGDHSLPAALHRSMYDRYNIELSDLQILVGKARDYWKCAHSRPTSALHLLDRFSISIQVELCAWSRCDPVYPRVLLRGSLPALVAHVSEQKAQCLRQVLNVHLPSMPDDSKPDVPLANRDEDTASVTSEENTEVTDTSMANSSRAFVVQFAIDQMSLEVVSRGRGIAELQVSGVRVGWWSRGLERTLALSVHSLLVGDALQAYGADTELLAASHRHVTMDFLSGSMRGSCPASPASPASPSSPELQHRQTNNYDFFPQGFPDLDRSSPGPAWNSTSNTFNTTSGPFSSSWAPSWATPGANTGHGPSWANPSANTAHGPSWGANSASSNWAFPGLLDSEALIAIELSFIKGEGDSEDLRIANILFNNLDIIANQETILELVGFTQRVLGPLPGDKKPDKPETAPPSPTELSEQNDAGGVTLLGIPHVEEAGNGCRTEVTFDFLRLGVLVIRGSMEGGVPVAHKVATATLSEAHIQATIGGTDGKCSVSGSLGGVQVVSLCAGTGLHSRTLSVGRGDTHTHTHTHTDRQGHTQDNASNALHFTITKEVVPAQEDEGEESVLVSVSVSVARVWYAQCNALVAELSLCLRDGARAAAAAAADVARHLAARRMDLLTSSGKSWSMDGSSPRRRSAAVSLDDVTFSPNNNNNKKINYNVCVELESPVVVVPRGAASGQVVVAHLGRLRLRYLARPIAAELADIALTTVDVTERLQKYGLTSENMQMIYDTTHGTPVLHNTALELTIDYDQKVSQWTVCGRVVGGLVVGITRSQCALLCAAARHVTRVPNVRHEPQQCDLTDAHHQQLPLLCSAAVPTLQLDPCLRAAAFATPPSAPAPPAPPHHLTVEFLLPHLTVELRGEEGGAGEGQGLVQLACREFTLHYRRDSRAHTNLQMSLYSITMEDLTQPADSKHRMMMLSHTPQLPKATFLSRSCTNLPSHSSQDKEFQRPRPPRCASLPDRLVHIGRNNNHSGAEGGVTRSESSSCPTPPCSPESPPLLEEQQLASDDSLVTIAITNTARTKSTKVEFNCLELVVSIESWMPVLDLFELAGDEEDDEEPPLADPARGGDTVDAPANDPGVSTQLSVWVVSLGVTLCARGTSLCRARVCSVAHRATTRNNTHDLTTRLGAFTVIDMQARHPLSRDRLKTHAPNALTLTYNRTGSGRSVLVELGPVTYVHTARFVCTLQAFVRNCAAHRNLVSMAKQKVTSRAAGSVVVGVVRCGSLVLVLPVSAGSRLALVAQLSSFNIETKHKHQHVQGEKVLVAERTITFSSAGVWGGAWSGAGADTASSSKAGRGAVSAGGNKAAGGADTWCGVRRRGDVLLPARTTFTLRATQPQHAHPLVPDLYLEGCLTKLEVSLDPWQYKLIRGVLAHNLADGPPPPPPEPSHEQQVRKTTCISLDLEDVVVNLEPNPGVSSLACINFIKCRLLLESFSDGGQDIDLVSQEILVSDTRFTSEPANRRANVFSNIVQPLPQHHAHHPVQAELHSRRRRDSSAYTIIINKMRLMMIFEWWELAHQFIMQPPPHKYEPDLQDCYSDDLTSYPGSSSSADNPEGHMELKLNISECQLVLVEDASVWDTNAVILKSTMVVQYRGRGVPLSCTLSDVELFSCVLGLEEETALCIVAPAALHLTLHPHQRLTVVTHKLGIRLSYHDMRMFAAILQSLPDQLRAALPGKSGVEDREPNAPANVLHLIGHRNARHKLALPLQRRESVVKQQEQGMWPIKAVEVRADCVSLCIIDDCLDSDVPLLDVTLTDFVLDQDLRSVEEAFSDPLLVSTPCGRRGATPSGGAGAGAGAGGAGVRARVALDYYNRPLSAWEPLVEPVLLSARWQYTLTDALSLARLQVDVHSDDTLNVNVTSALIDLGQLVCNNWTADYYAPQCGGADGGRGVRRRSPFVPYALRNLTGHALWFAPLPHHHNSGWLSGGESGSTTTSAPVSREGEESWSCVPAGETAPFSLGAGERSAGGGGGAGGGGAIALRLEGWTPPHPVAVTTVTTAFRNITHNSGAEARLVIEVALEGSARKLVTVRSALLLINRLPHPLRLKIAPPQQHSGSNAGGWSGVVAAGAVWACPLWPRPPAALHLAPAPGAAPPLPPLPLVRWHHKGERPLYTTYQCRLPQDQPYWFTVVVVRERFPPSAGSLVPGHTLYVVPALQLESLLPLELEYRTAGCAAAQRLPPAATHSLTTVNVERGVELSLKVEGFGWSGALGLGGEGGAAGGRVKLRDERGRALTLHASLQGEATRGVKVTISCSYWVVNRLGVPLVFRGEGGELPAQGPDHEVARMLQPLLVSFAETDGPPTLAMRLGKGVGAQPEWCSPFGLGPGSSVRRVWCRGGTGSVKSYWCCVTVRQGRGRHRRTNIAVVRPLYLVRNYSQHTLQILPTDQSEASCPEPVTIAAGSRCAWHAGAARVRGLDPATAPSASIVLQPPNTYTLTCKLHESEPLSRSSMGWRGVVALRGEVCAGAGSVELGLWGAESAPPPALIHNYCPIAIMFHQVGSTEEQVVGAHSSVRWAGGPGGGGGGAGTQWGSLALRAPGSPRLTLPLDHAAPPLTLTYQNFLYVAFTHSAKGTRPPLSEMGGARSRQCSDDVLVLEVPLESNRVVLGRKRYGDRAQLWRQGAGGRLVHEGSSPPQPSDAPHGQQHPHAMVLDIEWTAPRADGAAPLCVRRVSARRDTTQHWRAARGRLECAHANLAAAPQALTPGSPVFLALTDSRLPAERLPPAQRVELQTLRPGSGHLEVTLHEDGPTKVITITDPLDKEACWLEAESHEEPQPVAEASREWGARVSLAALGVSLVGGAPPAELLYAVLWDLRLDLEPTRAALCVTDMQWDNQLPDVTAPVALCTVPPCGAAPPPPALRFAASLLGGRPHAPRALQACRLHLAPLAVNLDERLMLALFVWAGGMWEREEGAGEGEGEGEGGDAPVSPGARLYVGALQLMPSQIRLSMYTYNKVEEELVAARKQLGLTLIRFEDARVELEPYQRLHALDTPANLAAHMLKHFRMELKWQAAKILGSVDFLGNPLGFVADVSEGVSGLIYEGSVGALLKNVTHGISNSAAKVTESISDGLERVVVDEAHEETRRRIRSVNAGSHLAAGFRGLGLGILGGMTSLVKHSYEGAAAEGLGGFVAGVGKGLVGTVTKPVIGLLDLANETASALRDTARRSDRVTRSRVRLPRAWAGPSGAGTRYCAHSALGARYLAAVRTSREDTLRAYVPARALPHDVRALLSSHYLRIFTVTRDEPHVVMETHLSNVVSCTAVSAEGCHFVELAVRGGGAGEALRRPRVQCDSAALAHELATHVARAHHAYHEHVHTLPPRDDL